MAKSKMATLFFPQEQKYEGWSIQKNYKDKLPIQRLEILVGLLSIGLISMLIGLLFAALLCIGSSNAEFFLEMFAVCSGVVAIIGAVLWRGSFQTFISNNIIGHWLVLYSKDDSNEWYHALDPSDIDHLSYYDYVCVRLGGGLSKIPKGADGTKFGATNITQFQIVYSKNGRVEIAQTADRPTLVAHDLNQLAIVVWQMKWHGEIMAEESCQYRRYKNFFEYYFLGYLVHLEEFRQQRGRSPQAKHMRECAFLAIAFADEEWQNHLLPTIEKAAFRNEDVPYKARVVADRMMQYANESKPLKKGVTQSKA